MSSVISRRDFLKASSAVGLAAAINPATAVSASTKKSRVVIATDTSSVSSTGVPNATKIQDLVDHAIMTLTGKSDTASAYEALFPAPVTTSTKIMMKRNDASGGGNVNTAVTNAFKKSLTTMLGNKFPSANINVVAQMGDASSSTKAATYIINCPVAWAHVMPQNSYGVTLSLKNTMSYLSIPSANHGKLVNGKYTWLWENSLNSAIKPKQILSLMDAVVGNATSGPGTSPTFTAGTVIVSSDLVAVDYNTIRLMEKQTNAKLDQLAIGDKELKDAEAAGLGTATPANMDVIKITAPWPAVGTLNGSDVVMESLGIRVINHGDKVDFVIPGGSLKHVGIFDLRGALVWQSTNFNEEHVSWNNITLSGAKPASGMYVFRITSGTSVMRGTVMMRN